MEMEFQVFKSGKLLFTLTIRLPEAAPMAQVNEFSKMAEAQFREAHPNIKLTDRDVVTKWVPAAQLSS